MKFRMSDLWRMDGTIDRGRYLSIGLVLTAIKVTLDFLVATRLFDRPWTPIDYAMPGRLTSAFLMPPEDRYFYRVLLLIALPFLFTGVALTVRRLRSAGLPLYAAVLFFAPMPVNLIFFLALSVLPSRPDRVEDWGVEDVEMDGAKPKAIRMPRNLVRAMSQSSIPDALLAVILPIPFEIVLTSLSSYVLRDYGWSVFVGIPFAFPMISVILFGFRRPRSFAQCLGVGMLWLLVIYGLMLIVAFEGLLCLIMALPLVLPVVLLGSAVGYLIQTRPIPPADTVRLLLVLLAALPTMIGAESVAKGPAPLFEARSRIEIEAPPERVWAHVIRFDPLPPPTDWAFRAGVAYPMRAVIDGKGVGAVRHCVFSTGSFIEPIEVWDEPHLLRFRVASNPPPMREWNPFAEIHPPHLDGFLVSHRGQFRLIPLPNGHTLLEGTTWYQHHLWPAAYWRLWSDSIIHLIHRRVLEHIKTSAERAGADPLTLRTVRR